DSAALGDEQEPAGCGNPIFRNHESGPAVEDGAGGSAARARCRRYRHDERHGLSAAVQKVRDAAAVLGEPEWAGGTEGNPPGVDEVRVRDAGQSRHVRGQVDQPEAPREETAIVQALEDGPTGALPVRPNPVLPAIGQDVHGAASPLTLPSPLGG